MTKEESWLLAEKYNGEKTEGFFADCTRLASGEPLAYLIGHVPFLSAIIYLDSHPLIPRPETEFWTERAIQEMQIRSEASLRVLDLCAGSGCIGIAVLVAIPGASVDFVELDESHRATILKNVSKNGTLVSRSRIMGGDLFERVFGKYDFILANPPYIDPCLARVEESVHAHEPHDALYGGSGGVGIITRILKGAGEYLTKNGVLYLEHEPEQTAFIGECARTQGFVTETQCDQYGVSRYTRLTRDGG